MSVAGSHLQEEHRLKGQPKPARGHGGEAREGEWQVSSRAR